MKTGLIRLIRHALAGAALAMAGLAWSAPPQLLLPHDGPVPKSGKAQGFQSDAFRTKFNSEEARRRKHLDEFELSLPNGKRHLVVTDMVEEHASGDVTFYGRIKNAYPTERVVITTGPAGSFGRISTPEGEFRLVPGNGHDWLVDMAAEAPHLPPIDLKHDTKVPPPLPKAGRLAFDPEYQVPIEGVNSLAVGHATPTPQTIVDLMIVYTPAYAANPAIGSGLTTRLNNLVASINTMLADSEVAITLRLVHAVQASSYTLDSAEDNGQALDRLTDGASPLSNIGTLRNQYGADMVMMLRNGPSTGGSGVAWVVNSAMSSAHAPYMYSVIDGCLTSCEWVHAHELAHNMGTMHDRATSQWENGGMPTSAPNEGSYSYSYGFYSCQNNLLSCNLAGGCSSQPECSTGRTGTNNFADIMAYFHGSTLRNLKFSNPNLTCRGSLGINLPCGATEGLPNAANAALSMNNNRVALSAMRATMVPLPPTTPPAVATTTTVSASPSPTTIGAAVAITASVSASSGTPTGTVHFRAGGSSITGCTAVSISSGTAVCNTSFSSAGTRGLTAQYSGATGFSGSTSSTVNLTVNSAVSTIVLGTSANPAGSGTTLVLTARVAGSSGTPRGTVRFTAGGNTIAGCSDMTLSASAPAIATCNVASLARGTHAIAATYSGDSTYLGSATPTLTQTIVGPAQLLGNVALSSAGASATASSSYGTGYPAAAVINGDRTGSGWGAGGGWNDATGGAYPDWVQVDFAGVRSISRVNVYTLQDSYSNPSEPTDTMTFTLYGVSSFVVEGWTGSGWTTLGSVSGNNLVKRTVDFAPFATNRIRVSVTSGAGGYSRLTEIEAFGAAEAVNVAAASAGGAASASSLYGPGYAAATTNNGDRAGLGWGTSGGWNDGSGGAYPDWVQINFSGTKSIDRVVVYTVQNNYAAPSEPTDSMTFSLYGIVDFTVQGWNGSGWVTLGTVTGNNLVKRTVDFAPFNTDSIRVSVTNGMGGFSRITEIEAWGVSTSTNVALASAGATASASSVYTAGYPASSVINGDRRGLNWGSGGGWNDGTGGVYPDLLEVDFGAARSINRVVVYTVQDAYATPAEPTDTMTFTRYGLVAFTVEGWNGSAWVPLGSVSGNNLVKRTIDFSPFTTDRIRINASNGTGGYSRVTEVEAWGN